jgi:hypothetical protein
MLAEDRSGILNRAALWWFDDAALRTRPLSSRSPLRRSIECERRLYLIEIFYGDTETPRPFLAGHGDVGGVTHDATCCATSAWVMVAGVRGILMNHRPTARPQPDQKIIVKNEPVLVFKLDLWIACNIQNEHGPTGVNAEFTCYLDDLGCLQSRAFLFDRVEYGDSQEAVVVAEG